MKRILTSIALLASLSSLYAVDVRRTAGLPFRGNLGVKPERASAQVANVIKDFEGKVITEPHQLFNQWNQLKADMLSLHAQELKEVAAQTNAPDKYLEVAKKMEKLAGMIHSLPKVTKDIHKSCKNIREWMRLKARKADLVAQQMAVLANQAGNPQAKHSLNFMGQTHKNMGHVITQALALLPVLPLHLEKPPVTTTPLMAPEEGTEIPQEYQGGIANLRQVR